ncbi:MAG: Fur family transcriptional regulator [Acidimicrobiia bacterium]
MAEALVERLRRRGWRMTPQRRSVVEVLAGDHVHLTAEQVLVAARRSVPEVSQATVYNTLNELVGMGEVQELRVAGGATLYDPNATDGHHHLVCRTCNLVFDVRPTGVDDLGLSRHERHGFAVDDVDVTFWGTCATCAERS